MRSIIFSASVFSIAAAQAGGQIIVTAEPTQIVTGVQTDIIVSVEIDATFGTVGIEAIFLEIVSDSGLKLVGFEWLFAFGDPAFYASDESLPRPRTESRIGVNGVVLSPGLPSRVAVLRVLANSDGAFDLDLNMSFFETEANQLLSVTGDSFMVSAAGPGDVNGDGNVDSLDTPRFLARNCFGGPGVPPPRSCNRTDIDGDHDTDLGDIREYFNLYTGPAKPAGPAQLLVANFLEDTVSVFDDPFFLGGNVAPTTQISGPNTGLFLPSDLFVNSAGELLVINLFGQITVYENAKVNGNVPPDRTAQIPPEFLFSEVMIYDPIHDALYILGADFQGNEIIGVFEGTAGPGFGGTIFPDRIITPVSNLMGQVCGGDYDPQRDILYVADCGNNKVIAFDGISGPSFDPERDARVFEDSRWPALPPFAIQDLAIKQGSCPNPVNPIHILGASGTIYRLPEASTLTGQVTAQTCTIAGAQFTTSIEISCSDTAFVADFGLDRIYVMDNVSTCTGVTQPDRTITGAGTRSPRLHFTGDEIPDRGRLRTARRRSALAPG